MPRGKAKIIDPRQINATLLYPSSEAAQILGITPSGLRGLVFRRKLRGRRIGGRLFILGRDLLEFLQVDPEEIDPSHGK